MRENPTRILKLQQSEPVEAVVWTLSSSLETIATTKQPLQLKHGARSCRAVYCCRCFCCCCCLLLPAVNRGGGNKLPVSSEDTSSTLEANIFEDKQRTCVRACLCRGLIQAADIITRLINHRPPMACADSFRRRIGSRVDRIPEPIRPRFRRI